MLNNALKELVILKKASISVNISASAIERFLVDSTTPSGYSLVAASPISHSQYLSLSMNRYSDAWYVTIRNNSASERNNLTVTVYYLYLKTSLIIIE